MNALRSWPEFQATLRVPLVLAPMAGGVGTPALAAAVSQAGGLGSLGAAYLTPTQIGGAMAAVRAHTDRPFLVNLFAPQPVPTVTPAAVALALEELAPFHAALHLPPPTLPPQVQEDFGAQLNAVLADPPAAFSFAFGRLPPAALDALHAAGVLVIGTATSLREAHLLAQDGVDAVTVQGGAAGGHRGGWMQDDHADTLHLTRQVSAALSVPVIAAGGLMAAADVQAALQAGAALAQCGTAFLLADEAGTTAPYRAALREGRPTVLTRAFSGRPARGLRNSFTDTVTSPLPTPTQNALTRPLRAAAAQAGNPELLSLWAGDGYRQARTASAAQIVADLTP
ncbi:NAD(P)H-dependent flavin oxidoreductase [Deinococcus depolymerans]|uniref:Propionate 3-nitronate monooxygenase n=1 Tax=Deinococcus depolymerans TaxID=392408 RepID=A0ABN1BM45_9DEIO